MRAFSQPLAVGGNGAGHSDGADGQHAAAATSLPGPVTYQRDPQALFAGESLGQALRQLVVYGRDLDLMIFHGGVPAALMPGPDGHRFLVEERAAAAA
jgi:hypothetical protein